MQKSLSELSALSQHELSAFIDGLEMPLLVTDQGEPRFVIQRLEAFENGVRRLRALEALHRTLASETERCSSRGKLFSLRRLR